jgi:hypothetical protein
MAWTSGKVSIRTLVTSPELLFGRRSTQNASTIFGKMILLLTQMVAEACYGLTQPNTVRPHAQSNFGT